MPRRPAPREPTARPRAAQAGAPAAFTVVVGQKPSAAQYFVNDHEEVVELCQSLRLHSTRANRNRSMGDLQRLHSGREWTSKLGGMPAPARGVDAAGLDWSRAAQPSAYPGGVWVGGSGGGGGSRASLAKVCCCICTAGSAWAAGGGWWASCCRLSAPLTPYVAHT